jgi:hypothetical protein
VTGQIEVISLPGNPNPSSSTIPAPAASPQLTQEELVARADEYKRGKAIRSKKSKLVAGSLVSI